MAKGFDYGIDLDKLRLDVPEELRDNYIAIDDALQKIQSIINDIDKRLEEAGF